MRQTQKEQAENIIELLGRVHIGIKKAIEQGRYESAMELLSQCQESAIELGETIEEIEGEGFVTVSFLENYCEIVYQCYALVSQAQSINAGKVYKNLKKALVPVENSVKNDISVRREAVFLPYKASMWDSLESVWKAADEDPDCDAYVIPIPYFDKNPDGSFREMHYEGDQYPDYVPVTSYEKFDFEEHHPDMIFIHNPYDECNYVTSVHPFFYSKNLKKFTDKLVYIPYFILGEIDPDDKAAVEGMAHFCTVPGVIYADKVIVQSEKMRQVYIDVMTEFSAGGMPERAESAGRKISEAANRKYWEEKILGLGSPKVDKVLNTRKENLEIPEEWLHVIEKPDGSWKKIIFYNTSVTALLEHGEKMLEKMQDVFRVFEENKDEVALLWRPHPLIQATIESMRPGLWAEYEKLVREYRDAGWGIYDDTADMDRAVVLSDGYYGNRSSVVCLYEAVKKAVVIQNENILTYKESNLCCVDIVKYNSSLFILTRDTQCLFLYCPASGKMKLCGTVARRGEVFVSMTVCNNKLYIAPYIGKEICVYDIDNEEFRRISLGQPCGKLKRDHYHMCFNYCNKVYLLGNAGSVMIYLDSDNGIIKEISKWKNEFEAKYGYMAAIVTHMDACIVKGCLWVALKGDNLLLEYNLLTDEYNFWNVGRSKMQYVTVSFDGKYFWLSGDKRFIVRWEKETNESREFGDFPDGFEFGNKKAGWKELFSCGKVWNDHIYFTPLNSNMLIRLDLRSEQMECVKKVCSERICFKIAEINNKIYIEEIGSSDLFFRSSYMVEADGSYGPYSLKIGTQDDVIFVNIWHESEENTFVESHPKFMGYFVDILLMMKCKRMDNRFFHRQELLGKNIFDNICNG